MKKCKVCGLPTSVFVAIVSSLVALFATATAFLIVKEKKRRDEEELERYLDESIQ